MTPTRAWGNDRVPGRAVGYLGEYSLDGGATWHRAQWVVATEDTALRDARNLARTALLTMRRTSVQAVTDLAVVVSTRCRVRVRRLTRVIEVDLHPVREYDPISEEERK